MRLEQLTQDPRVLVRPPCTPDADGRAVVYWMQRAQRATDNAALDVAIHAGNALGLPVVACFGLTPAYPGANLRHYRFMADGFAAVADGLRTRRVGFVLRRHPDHDILRLCDEVNAALLVGDENPLREPERWRADCAARTRLPFWTVDADVVVPGALFVKEQYAARTLRPRIRPLVNQFLAAAPEPKARVAWTAPKGLQTLQPDASALDGLGLDMSVAPVTGMAGGPAEAGRVLRRFLRQRLAGYADLRNHPDLDATSRLSPYLHFGHIGPREVARAVAASDAPKADRDAFLEEFIVRRELATNFVRFNPCYDRLEGCEPWARRTLAAHAGDTREPCYAAAALERAETHDPLWNAAQIQMVETGWMHGYVRMYWAKKILEWSGSPEEAFATAVALNDRYELDGRDPNGYTGVAWAIGGKHDRAWGPERPVYGTVRYMSYASTSRKFDSRRYIHRVGEETGRHVAGA
jgi:deoxyribodipyrimidine photo-lyase